MYIIKIIARGIKWLDKKGSSHFTVMFIPHSQSKVLSFQISNYTVSLVFLLFGFVLFSLYHYSLTKKDLLDTLKEVEEKDKAYWSTHKAISKNVQQSQGQMKKLAREINGIYQIIANRDYLNWSPPPLDVSDIEKKYDLAQGIPKNVYKINEVRHSLLETGTRFREIQKLLDTRRQIIDHLPTRWPVFGDKGYKTSGFGKRYSPFEGKHKFHGGVDIASFPDTPVVAAADGVVTFVGIKDGYGNTLMLKHKYGYHTLYGHNSRILVRPGQKVKKGEKIALLGRTGRATGYHVHFEIRINNVPVDPWSFITVEI